MTPIRRLLGLTALFCSLVASTALAQSPDLYWEVRDTGKSQADCMEDANGALRTATLYNVLTGSKPAGARFASGANSNLRAVVICSKAEKSLAAVIVAGTEGHLEDTGILGDYLLNYMQGERNGPPQLSVSEEPVEMNQWLSSEFCLGCDGSEAEQRFSGEIASPARSIRVRVYSGVSEDGDGSVEVLMYDPNGRLVLTEESNHDDWAEWRVGVVGHGQYELVLRSLSATGTTGSRNQGEIQVLVR